MSSSRKPKTINPDKVDPSVYYYDEVYDDMQQERESDRSRGRDGTSSKDRHKGSKYIDGLKETAELRRTEKELRKFKRYARDREEAEAEGDVSREDVYVSESYKRKLAEIKQLEAEKLQRYEREQDKTMNFVKKYSKSERSDPNRSREQMHKPENKSSPDESHEPATLESGGAEDTEAARPTATSHRRKRPKTMSERRQYLRELLKKRTTGKVYDEAVQRYMQRRALSQR